MDKLTVDRHKNKNLSKEELLKLSKEELVEAIIQFQAHTKQLKNIIAKNNSSVQKINTKSNDKGKNKREFDFSKCHFRRILLRISYLGGRYSGLAVQEDCPLTVEALLFSALTRSCLIRSRDSCGYHRCGRTDKGVSASGQVISLEVRSKLTQEELSSPDSGRHSELQYCKLLNRLLPEDIRAVAWSPAPQRDGEPYSARFDCSQRTYKYWFPIGAMDLSAMRQACSHLQGSHDFRNLCKMDVANGVTSFIRQIHAADIVPENEEQPESDGYSMYYLQIQANAFLWHQIRCMAAILFLIGSGHEKPEVMTQLLDVDKNPRKPQYNMAIEAPLNLFHCKYDVVDDEYHIKHQEKQSTLDKNDLESDTSMTDVKNDLESDTSMTDVKNGLGSDKAMPDVKNESDRLMTDAKYDNENNRSMTDVKKDTWCVDLTELENVIKSFQTQWSTAAIQASMIKDIIQELECLYNRKLQVQKINKCNEKFTERVVFKSQNECLLQGVKSKIYQPLLKRTTCESLENRIEHYVKKKRLRRPSKSSEETL